MAKKIIQMIKIIKRNKFPIMTAEGEKRFWLRTGQILANLSELAQALDQMDDDTFCHHVNSECNDFSNWIIDVLGDAKLGADIKKIKTAKTMAKKIRSYI